VDKLAGSEHAKERLRVILEVTGGQVTRKEGAAELGLSERSYRDLRDRALLGALSALEPRPPGRPRRPRARTQAELAAQNKELRIELELARLREEIAILMPELVVRRERVPPRRGVAGKRRTQG
jgi:transposase-like protein